MRGQPDLFGDEIVKFEDEIVKIAREVAEKRRVAEEELARKYGKQQRLDGTVPVCRGYATYEDFEEYIKQIVVQERLKLFGWDLSKVKSKIRKTLLAAGWTASEVHPEIRFYPPSTE